MFIQKILNNAHHLMAPKDESGGGGGGILDENSGDGGAGSGGGTGGEGTGGAGDKGGAGAGDAGGGKGGKVEIPANWHDAIPEELRNQVGNFANFKTVEDLVKSYQNAQKMIGADKIALPRKDAALKELREQVLSKIGLPEKLEDYKFDLERKDGVDKEFLDGFKKTSHELGILPAQAKALGDWFDKTNEAAYQAQVKAGKDASAAELKALRDEWGDAYQENVASAKAALREFADKETQEYIRKHMGSDPKLIKLLARVGETLGEDKIRGEGGTGGTGKMSPGEAQQQIDAIVNNIKHPYYDKGHVDHPAAKNEMRKLREIVDPPVKIPAIVNVGP